jgi:predicted type IV restriction endonuclease
MTASVALCKLIRTGTSSAVAATPLELVILMSPASTIEVPASLEALGAALRQVVDRIPRLRAQGSRISEQDTKRILITPAVEALGWDSYDIEEVRNEYRHNSADNPVDYALFLNRSPVLFIEAKPLGHTLDDRRWIVQTINYANAAGVDWCALTNGAEWRIYKVHAQVEADRKLFTTVTLDNPDGLTEAVRVLSLLSRDNMRVRAIDELWQAWHVDRQVREALDHVLQDDAFATLVRKRVPQITPIEVRKSLRRANISVSYPSLFPSLASDMEKQARPSQASESAPDAPQSASHEVPTELAAQPMPSDRAPITRRQFQSTQDLFELGKLKAGQTLSIKGRANSAARVIDGKSVEFRGQTMSYLAWGKQVTGWQAVQIYTVAVTADGRTLDELRDQPQRPLASSPADK